MVVWTDLPNHVMVSAFVPHTRICSTPQFPSSERHEESHPIAQAWGIDNGILHFCAFASTQIWECRHAGSRGALLVSQRPKRLRLRSRSADLTLEIFGYRKYKYEIMGEFGRMRYII
jgi:hypothetical protein